MSLLALPNELLLQIVSSLDGPSIYSLLLTNRRLASLLSFVHLAHACDSIQNFTTAVFCAATSKSEHRLRFLLAQTSLTTNLSTGVPQGSPNSDITIHTLSPSSPGAHLSDKFDVPNSVASILASAPKIVVVRERRYGGTPLHFAAKAGQEIKVRMLLRRGHNIDIKNHSKDSALLIALINGHDNIVRLLIESGANTNSLERSGHTMFHLTAARGHSEIVELMLRKGASIEGRDREGHTALHYAAQKGDIGMVKLLLRKGADVNARVMEYSPFRDNDWGYTPLQLATRRRRNEVVEILLAHGAKSELRG